MVVSKEGCLAITPSAMQVSANVLDAQHHTEFTHTNFLKGGIDKKLLTRRNREDLLKASGHGYLTSCFRVLHVATAYSQVQG